MDSHARPIEKPPQCPQVVSEASQRRIGAKNPDSDFPIKIQHRAQSLRKTPSDDVLMEKSRKFWIEMIALATLANGETRPLFTSVTSSNGP